MERAKRFFTKLLTILQFVFGAIIVGVFWWMMGWTAYTSWSTAFIETTYCSYSPYYCITSPVAIIGALAQFFARFFITPLWLYMTGAILLVVFSYISSKLFGWPEFPKDDSAEEGQKETAVSAGEDV